MVSLLNLGSCYGLSNSAHFSVCSAKLNKEFFKQHMTNQTTNYQNILSQAKAITTGEPDIIANMANISAILYHEMPNINWAGFYLYKDLQLVLGPFQGKVACIRIPMGKGVCGRAAKEKVSLLVDNVHDFDGHIACDAASNSEIVCPVIKNGHLIGVLDIDSPIFSRFSQEDKIQLEALVDILVNNIE